MTSLKKSSKQLSLKIMDGTKEQYRFYIFTRLQLGDSIKKIHDDLQAVYGTNCVPYSTMYKWIQAFRSEQSSSKSGTSPGRPFLARNEQNIALVERLVAEDPHSTIRELSEACDLSTGTIHSILHEDLHMRKLAARWVPHLLSEEQKKRRVACSRQLLNDFEPNGPKRLCDIVTGDETWLMFYGIPNKRCNRAWVGPDGDRPVVLRPGFQSRKRLFSIFFNAQGTVAIDILPEKASITATYYTEVVLPKVVKEVCNQRPTVGTSRTLLLHDNASAHKAKVTTTFLGEQGIHVLDHPPYSPDLAPCDFWLFPILKERLAGHKFDRVQDLAKAVKSQLDTIPKEDYQRALCAWRRRLETCVRVKGEYFEGM